MHIIHSTGGYLHVIGTPQHPCSMARYSDSPRVHSSAAGKSTQQSRLRSEDHPAHGQRKYPWRSPLKNGGSLCETISAIVCCGHIPDALGWHRSLTEIFRNQWTEEYCIYVRSGLLRKKNVSESVFDRFCNG